MFRRVLKEPLLHFLVLGAAIFVVFHVTRDPSANRADRIVVSSGSVAQMIEGFTRTWQRPPTEQELQGLINDYIKEEVLYREAISLGLDRDDTIVRRRMSQKLDFLSEDLNRLPDPTQNQLREFLAKHPEKFRIGTKISFTQIYFNPDRRGAATQQDVEELRKRILENNGSIDLTQVGDPFLLQPDQDSLLEADIEKLFGAAFASELLKIKPGQWTGPLKSEYGLHLVVVRARTEGRLPDLSEIRSQVQREWTDTQRRERKVNFYKNLREKYTVKVDLPEHLKNVAELKGTE